MKNPVTRKKREQEAAAEEARLAVEAAAEAATLAAEETAAVAAKAAAKAVAKAEGERLRKVAAAEAAAEAEVATAAEEVQRQDEAEAKALAARGGHALLYADEDERVLYCLHQDNPVRHALIEFIRRPEFDAIVLIAIVVNAAVLVSIRPLEPVQEWQEQAELGFNIFFTFEMAAKVLALGLALGEFSYLRSPWNQLDALVVVTGWVSIR